MDTRKTKINNILNCFKSIKRSFAPDHGNGRFDLPMSQVGALVIIKKNNGINVTDLANKLEISKSATTQLIDSLIHRSLVVRSTNTDDRRVVTVELSSAGKKHFAVMHNKMLERFYEVFGVLDDNELNHLEQITQKLADTQKKENK
jgi:DNA-binding MarR family transcriptional regulator